MLAALGPTPATALDQATVSTGRVQFGAASNDGTSAGVAQLARPSGMLAAAFCGSLYGAEGAPSASTGSQAAQQILERYAAKGIDILRELRGEFSLAIWDEATDSLHLATDPFRIHQLFYTFTPQGLAFSSRLKSLRTMSPGSPAIEPRSIVDVVASSYIPSPRTIFQGMWKLPPAHRLTDRGGTREVAPYWDLDFRHPSSEPFDVLAGRLRSVLKESVADRLRGDAGPARRVGTFLSGGIDSSTVTGLVGEISGHPAPCFTIGFAEARYNETNYARIAAQAFRADHHERVVTPADVLAILPMLHEAFDEPFANASAIPTYYCARLAREHGMDVLYAGDGGDELFAGNERYASRRMFDSYRAIPPWLRGAILEPLIAQAASRVRLTILERTKRFIDRANSSHFERITAYNLLRLHPVTEFFHDEFVESLGKDFAPYEAERDYCEHAPADSELDRELYLDLKMAISDNDVIKVTRMCQAADMEVRFPFLDRLVAEFATIVPAALKLRGGELRWFFKQAYADFLPSEVRGKKKHGFGLPIPVWLRTEPTLRNLAHDLVLGSGSRAAAYFRAGALADLVARHERDTSSFYGTILWNVVVLELYLRSVGVREPG